MGRADYWFSVCRKVPSTLWSLTVLALVQSVTVTVSEDPGLNLEVPVAEAAGAGVFAARQSELAVASRVQARDGPVAVLVDDDSGRLGPSLLLLYHRITSNL